MKRIPRCILTAEFKREANKLVAEQGLTLEEVGRKLGAATKSLRTWMDQQERGKLKPSLGASKLTPDQQRIRELDAKAGHREDGARHLKKRDGVLREGVEVKYAMIDKLRNQYPVAKLCALLDVAKSGRHGAPARS